MLSESMNWSFEMLKSHDFHSVQIYFEIECQLF
jgi:hypothetical protein